MKFCIQAIERLLNLILTRFDSIGALELPQGQSLGSLGVPKPPLGHKILIFGGRKLKFDTQVVERLMNCMLERFHTSGVLPPPPRADPRGTLRP